MKVLPVVIIFFCCLSCNAINTIELNLEQLEILEISDIQIVNEGDLSYILRNEKNERQITNIENWVEINDDYFYFWLVLSDHKNFILGDKRQNRFQDFGDVNKMSFAPDFGILVRILSTSEFVGSYTLEVIDVFKNETLKSKDYSFEVDYVNGVNPKKYNYVETDLQYENNEFEGGIFSIYNTQAGYTFHKISYLVNKGWLLKQSQTIISREPIERNINNFSYNHNELELGDRNVTLKNEYNIVAVDYGNGNFAMVTLDSPIADNIDNYSLRLIDENGNEINQIDLGDEFIYKDPITDILGIKWADDEITFIIETKEFNYDFYYDFDSNTSDVQLRYLDFDRFVH